jgi:hypothetical protein
VTEDSGPPLLRVIHGGDPTPEETAALVAAVTVVAARATEREPVASSQWASRQAGLRRPLHPGPGAWAAGARPGR